jgi:hypothetical protein
MEKLKIEPKEVFVSYRSLISDFPNWGMTCENKEKAKNTRKEPGNNALTFAFLTHILDVLVEINEGLKRERTIK